jgi:hypothetical protein
MNLRFWFWDQLPPIFKELDTYKDNTGRGLFERYCEIFGLEYDNEVIPKDRGLHRDYRCNDL